jgi:hypothetical protein
MVNGLSGRCVGGILSLLIYLWLWLVVVWYKLLILCLRSVRRIGSSGRSSSSRGCLGKSMCTVSLYKLLYSQFTFPAVLCISWNCIGWKARNRSHKHN